MLKNYLIKRIFYYRKA